MTQRRNTHKAIIVEDIPISNTDIHNTIIRILIDNRFKPKLIRKLVDKRKESRPMTTVVFIQLHNQNDQERAMEVINECFGSNIASITSARETYSSVNTRNWGCVVQEVTLRLDENGAQDKDFVDLDNFNYPICEICSSDEHFTIEHMHDNRECPPDNPIMVINQNKILPTSQLQQQQQPIPITTNSITIATPQQQPHTPNTQRRLTVAARLEIQLRKNEDRARQILP
jgi:hypothetical protein